MYVEENTFSGGVTEVNGLSRPVVLLFAFGIHHPITVVVVAYMHR